jgi:hypothetical protein
MTDREALLIAALTGSVAVNLALGILVAALLSGYR